MHLPKIQLDRSQPIPLARQLYLQLQQQILQGYWAYREKLPASRVLAAELKVARGVVLECYEMLKIDGLIAGFGKGGSRVCYQSQSSIHYQTTAQTKPQLSNRGQVISCARNYDDATVNALPLTPGVPDLSLFPAKQWAKYAKQVSSQAPSWYLRTGGTQPLKQALQSYLKLYRGIKPFEPNQLIITTGTQGALCALLRLLADPGDYIYHEQLSWTGAAAAIAQAQLKAAHLPIDAAGAQLPARPQKVARAILITPTCQYPTGIPMSIARRKTFADYAEKNNLWLIEDDYAAEYSYAQHPSPSILGQMDSQHIIHMGTMSKLLFPGLRLGWILIPKHIAGACNIAANLLGLQPPYYVQEQLANFISYGHLNAHLANCRRIYSQRREACTAYIERNAADIIHVTPSISGMNHYLALLKPVDKGELSSALSQAGLGCEVYEQNKETFILMGHCQEEGTQLTPHLNKLFQCIRSIEPAH